MKIKRFMKDALIPISILLKFLGIKKYPTKQDIMKNPIKFKKETIMLIKQWKKIWKPQKLQKKRKLQALIMLIKLLAILYNKPIKTKYKPKSLSFGYSPKTKTITLNQTLSIISTLHEFAHHLHGPSELKACRWSIHLYKETFPKNFKKLKWKGHMLIKQKSS